VGKAGMSRAEPLYASMSRTSFREVFARNPSQDSIRGVRCDYPPFEDPTRRHECIVARGSMLSRSGSSGALDVPAVGLAPNRSFRLRGTQAAALQQELARMPRAPSKPKLMKSKSSTSANDEPEEEMEHRLTRNVGKATPGIVGRWEQQIAKKYSSVWNGVNTAKAFERMDKNRDNVLDRQEVYEVMKASGVKVTAGEFDELWDQADKNVDGHMSFDEFEKHVMKSVKNEFHTGSNRPKYSMAAGAYSSGIGEPDVNKKGNAKATDSEVQEYMKSIYKTLKAKYKTLEAAFAAADKDRSKHLSLDELAQVIKDTGVDIPMTHINELYYQVIDRNADGEVSYSEFCKKLMQWDSDHM